MREKQAIMSVGNTALDFKVSVQYHFPNIAQSSVYRPFDLGAHIFLAAQQKPTHLQKDVRM